ncbi:hypothetical protein ACOBQB_06645 [Streptomyces sp. G5(2025)]|uniref:hypothetical protein n=1 Tax=Streptomyces sp. G5(2025) TaxID=3406628 RepID=UPI003C294A5C
MGARHVHRARRLLEAVLDGPAEDDLVRAARTVVAELGSPERLLPLVAELAAGAGDPSGCALLSYRHVLGFDKLLLIDGGPRHRLRAHVWHPGADAREDVHNHRSPLASRVVRGALGMELYDAVEEAGDGGGQSAARYRESLSGAGGDWLLEPAGRARLRLTQSAVYAAGSGYALPSYSLHRAWCASSEVTVTLFLETGSGRRRYTDVFTGPEEAAETAETAVSTVSGESDAPTRSVVKEPLEVADYLAELKILAGLIG